MLALTAILLLVAAGGQVLCTDRWYYIAAEEVDWDYTSSTNDYKISGSFGGSNASTATGTAEMFRKAVFIEYTDRTFTIRKRREPWRGIIGPLIKGEMGDTLFVHFKNNVSHPCTIHPHGVHYVKAQEGALYKDGTTRFQKHDDAVQPGTEYTYRWDVHISQPLESTACHAFAYHSHHRPENDINTGLVGALLICRRNVLGLDGHRLDGRKDFVILSMVFDESKSWFKDFNEHRAGSGGAGSYWNSTSKFHSMNGLLNDTLKGLEMCVGDQIEWHLLSLGGQTGMHTAHLQGNGMLSNGHRTDYERMLPARSISTIMVPDNNGTFSLACLVMTHYNGGMHTSYTVSWCKPTQQRNNSRTGSTRNYFLSIEESLWSYDGKTGQNKFNDKSLDDDEEAKVFFAKTNMTIGGTYLKALYNGYTSDSFSDLLPKPAHMGLMGPPIYAEPGDTVLITLRNRASSLSFGIVSRGVVAHSQNSMAAPNQTIQVTWSIPESFAPTALDPDCLVWMYHSTDMFLHFYTGLVGPLLICKPGTLDTSGKPRNAVKEVFLLFSVFDENQSAFLQKNINEHCACNIDDDEFIESNKMHGINGFMYGNLPDLRLCTGETTHWYLMGFGDELDVHTLVVDGNYLLHNNRYTDHIMLSAGSQAVASMQPWNVGNFSIICQTSDHYMSGMKVWYTVDSCNSTATQSPPQKYEPHRVIHIAVEETMWSYLPSKQNLVTHSSTDQFKDVSEEYRLRRFKKMRYVEYQDASFRKPHESPDYLGILGPTIHAEVGDLIKVILYNKASVNVSLKPRTLMPLNNNSSLDNMLKFGVAPNQTATFYWLVTNQSGPGGSDKTCINHVYLSEVEPVKDLNSGLIGSLVVCKKGTLNERSERSDVNLEFPVLLLIFDEEKSHFWEDNLAHVFGLSPTDPANTTVVEMAKMHAINGRIFGNLDGLNTTVGDRVAWYVIGMGNEADFHTVHWHGHLFDVTQSTRLQHDVHDLLPGVTDTLEMTVDEPGSWMLHCHVSDHMTGGMTVLYHVHPRSTSSDYRTPIVFLAVMVAMMMTVLVAVMYALKRRRDS